MVKSEGVERYYLAKGRSKEGALFSRTNSPSNAQGSGFSHDRMLKSLYSL